MSALTTWYAGLNQREKGMINLLAIAMALLLLLVIVILPVKKGFSNLQANKDSYSATLPKVQRQVLALQGQGGAVRSSGSLNQMVTQSAKTFALNFTRIEEKKRNVEIQMNMDNVEFDQVLRWIADLEQSKGLLIDNLRVSSTDDVGRVNVSIRIVKPS